MFIPPILQSISRSKLQTAVEVLRISWDINLISPESRRNEGRGEGIIEVLLPPHSAGISFQPPITPWTRARAPPLSKLRGVGLCCYFPKPPVSHCIHFIVYHWHRSALHSHGQRLVGYSYWALKWSIQIVLTIPPTALNLVLIFSLRFPSSHSSISPYPSVTSNSIPKPWSLPTIDLWLPVDE